MSRKGRPSYLFVAPMAARAIVALVGLSLAAASVLKAAPKPAGAGDAVCTVLADAESGKLLIQEGVCDRRVTPASTFKIAISLMGYDSGFLKDEHSPALPFREGYPDWMPAWRTTTDPTGWIRNSVVWYSQQITLSLGEERFRRYVSAFAYGNENVSGAPGKGGGEGLTTAWLSSSLAISPLEQIEFLRKIVLRRLPVSARAYDMTSAITAIGALPNGWEAHGKTGTGAPRRQDESLDPDRAYGWFVGWASKGDRTVLFARLSDENGRSSAPAGPRTRDALLRELPALLNAL